jgi:hypothetical protein
MMSCCNSLRLFKSERGKSRVIALGLAVAIACFSLRPGLAVGSDAFGGWPISEISYPGASLSRPFTASDPYVVQIMGIHKPVSLAGQARTHDFSGDVPFVDATTGAPQPGTLQGFDQATGGARTYFGNLIRGEGISGRIEKLGRYTMIRYVANDGTTAGKCRTQLNSFPIPPRTRVRWELSVAFGGEDTENQWHLSPPRTSPVAFWQTKSPSGANPSMFAVVDTDPRDPGNSLALYFFRKGGREQSISLVATVHGIARGVSVPIIIDAFLDERPSTEGGKGRMQVTVNGAVVANVIGPTLIWGEGAHNWAISMYLFEEARPYPHTRASFWQTARLFVYPRG